MHRRAVRARNASRRADGEREHVARYRTHTHDEIRRNRAGSLARNIRDVDGYVALLFDVAHGHSVIEERFFEAKTAAEIESDSFAPVELKQVRRLVNELALFENAIESEVSAKKIQ